MRFWIKSTNIFANIAGFVLVLLLLIFDQDQKGQNSGLFPGKIAATVFRLNIEFKEKPQEKIFSLAQGPKIQLGS